MHAIPPASARSRPPSTRTARSRCCARRRPAPTTASCSSSAGAASRWSSTTGGCATPPTTPARASGCARCAARPPATPIRPRSPRRRCGAPPRPRGSRSAPAAARWPRRRAPTNQRLYTDRDPFDDAEFAVKVEMLREIDAYLRGLDPRVVQVSASLGASMQEVEILRPEGTRLAEARPMVRLNVSVIVEENGRREIGLGRRRRAARPRAADGHRPLEGRSRARRCASPRSTSRPSRRRPG